MWRKNKKKVSVVSNDKSPTSTLAHLSNKEESVLMNNDDGGNKKLFLSAFNE